MKLSKFIKTQSAILFLYDVAVASTTCWFILFAYLYGKGHIIKLSEAWLHTAIYLVILFICRLAFKIYSQIWRYGGVGSYLKLITSDFIALALFYSFERLIPMFELTMGNTISLFTINLLVCLTARIVYRYCYKNGNNITKQGKLFRRILRTFSFGRVDTNNISYINRINVAILGAGNVGTNLVTELLNNPNSMYNPVCYLENSKEKIDREINDLPIFSDKIAQTTLVKYNIQEVIFTVQDMDPVIRQDLYKYYKECGLSIKVYDYSNVKRIDEKKALREFDIEELLFRKPVLVVDTKTKNFYKNKVVLITGGGGSIGSEMCRQVAAMSPKKIVLVDVYENGVYDVRTEMNFAYGDKLDLNIEIANICDKDSLEYIFKTYKPDLVIHAAAHKHVPLMEHNVIESIKNNIFGTLNVVEIAEKYNVKRVIMVSTDKAVNPTNVMGATKRMCEMIVMCHAHIKDNKTTFSITRFGNVLNSAGSVVPIFKKELENGGPLTITDKRIIRYFMTIPEASQLVLKSGAMAKNGELFVLDMGKPVKILDLAETMIKLTGLQPYKDIDIVEIGLRPGEKLYEELLINSETLTKTSDELIFIEEDKPLTQKELKEKLNKLNEAISQNNNDKAKKVLKEVVPTFVDPDKFNKKVMVA